MDVQSQIHSLAWCSHDDDLKKCFQQTISICLKSTQWCSLQYVVFFSTVQITLFFIINRTAWDACSINQYCLNPLAGSSKLSNRFEFSAGITPRLDRALPGLETKYECFYMLWNDSYRTGPNTSKVGYTFR